MVDLVQAKAGIYEITWMKVSTVATDFISKAKPFPCENLPFPNSLECHFAPLVFLLPCCWKAQNIRMSFSELSYYTAYLTWLKNLFDWKKNLTSWLAVGPLVGCFLRVQQPKCPDSQGNVRCSVTLCHYKGRVHIGKISTESQQKQQKTMFRRNCQKTEV